MLRYLIDDSYQNGDQFRNYYPYLKGILVLLIRDWETKIAVFEWEEFAANSVQTKDVRDIRHSALCAEIVQKISKILHAMHNYALVGKFGSLKDTLLIVI